jgi:hypothetical protein
MKKLLCLAAILAFATAANAVDGRLFITGWDEGYGLDKPENACIPTFSEVDLDGNNYNAYDYYYGTGPFEVAAFPPAAHAGYGAGSPLALDPMGGGAYLWLQFDASMPKNATINGLQVEVWDAGTGMIADGFAPVTYYLQNDISSSGFKRWDGPATAPDYAEFTGNNPQVLVAVTAYGIKKTNLDNPSQLYTGMNGGFIALLGSICLDEMDPAGTYFVAITDINYTEGTADPANWGYDTYFTVIPEPATLMLLGLAGLVLRRR